MLSYGVKSAFFGLSISGLVACWTMLLIMSKIVDSYWLPIMYCIAITILEVSFCLGMIWKMDPVLMPLAFCQAQTILLSFGSFMATGVVISFTQATAMTVFRSGSKQGTPKSTLEYRHGSLPWIVAFPVIATVTLATVLVKLDSAKPQGDDMHCDSNSPEWVRFLGYAGVSVVIACPAFLVATATAYKLLRTHLNNRANYLSNSHGRSVQGTSIASPSSKTPHYQLARASSPPPNPNQSGGSGLGFSYAIPGSPVSRETFSIPPSPMHALRPLPPSPAMLAGGRALSVRTVSDFPDDNSIQGSTRPLASSSSHHSPQNPVGRRPAPDLTMLKQDALSIYVHHVDAPERFTDIPEEDPRVYNEKDESDEPFDRRLLRSYNEIGSTGVYTPPASLVPAIWRLALFQIAFFGIEILAALSTIIDVATKKTEPTPLGTQHFALLLAAWGPVIVFGHLPSVRAYISSCVRTRP